MIITEHRWRIWISPTWTTGMSSARSWNGPKLMSSTPTSAGGPRPGCITTTRSPNMIWAKKLFRRLPHRVVRTQSPLFRGFDDIFYIPTPCYTENRLEDIQRVPELELLAISEQAGVFAVKSSDNRRFFITGHRSMTRTPWPTNISGMSPRAGYRRTGKLLRSGRPLPPLCRPLAFRRPAFLYQLAQLLRLPNHSLRLEKKISD